jgi:hypothetical protein
MAMEMEVLEMPSSVQMMMMMITSEAKVEVLLKKRCETKL